MTIIIFFLKLLAMKIFVKKNKKKKDDSRDSHMAVIFSMCLCASWSLVMRSCVMTAKDVRPMR